MIAVRHPAARWITVGSALVVLFGTVGLASQLKTNFLDQSGQDTLTITQKLPVGTSLAATDAAAKKVEAVLARTDGVETYQVTVGGGGDPFGGGGGGSNARHLLASRSTRTPTRRRCSETLRERARRARPTSARSRSAAAAAAAASPPTSSQVIVQAADPATLSRPTEQVRAAMAEHAGRRPT